MTEQSRVNTLVQVDKALASGQNVRLFNPAGIAIPLHLRQYKHTWLLN